MAKDKHKKMFADTVFVYPCDYDDGKPVLCVSDKIADVEEDEPVGIYELVEVKGKAIKTTVVTFKE